MKIKPLADNVVIKATEQETTKSGIVLTSAAKRKAAGCGLL